MPPGRRPGRRRGRRIGPILFAAAAPPAVALLAIALAPGSSHPVPRSSPASADLALPEPVRPAFRVSKPAGLSPSPSLTHWAPVLRAVAARERPSAGAPAIASLDTRTPEDTTNLVVVLARTTDEAGRVWVRVRLPVLPNGTTGWVPRSALGGYVAVRTRLVIDLDRFRATLYRRGRRVFTADVGVGKAHWPTPRGEFHIRNKLTSFASPEYGPLAFGTSARSSVLTDWPAGGFVGIHGTDRPDLLPGRVSHGCVRLRNEDILELARLMPVGTPVTIR